MAQKSTVLARRQEKLLDALESRLDALTENLSAAPVAEKGLDVVKEIKELYSILRAVREGDKGAESAAPPRMILVWGESKPEGAS